MKTRSRAVGSLVATCALLVALPAAAQAAPTIAKLRVEAGGAPQSSGAYYVTDTTRLATRTRQCGKDRPGDSRVVSGPSAIGIVDHAQETNARLRPYLVSDTFDFGLIVCRIGDFGAFDANQAWLYRVNHEEAQVAADQYTLERRDEVLWYFADFASGENTGAELGLRAPTRVRPGVPFTVTAIAYDAEGRESPAVGAAISGADAPAVTGPDGRAQVTLTREGTRTLRAERAPNAIPAAPTGICVKEELSRCPERRPELIVGRNASDPIVGTPSPDRVVARAGNDRIDVRNKSGDDVFCGAGNDSVLTTPGDHVSADCERLNGKLRG